MAKETAKETAKPAAVAKEPEPKPAEPTQHSAVVGGIVADDLDVLGKPIDDRMAALLKDHQRMGARPK